MSIDDLLRSAVLQKASDLHLKSMRPPLLRINGKLQPTHEEPLSSELLREMLEGILTERLKARLDDKLAVDFGYSVPGLSRFRASIFYQRGSLSAVFRRVPFEFPSLEDWGLPPVLEELTKLSQGLVLVTGPTGSGKSSTIAAMMRMIVNTRLVHLVTIEDPIEFLLRDKLGAVTQREVGTDTPNFADALRNALRQDPDVIMVGECRDLETVTTVLSAAETGHLVFSTMHTNSSTQTVDRIVDLFPEGNHRQIRQQLSSVLQAIISMRLVERADGTGLIAAVEILRSTPRVQKLILDGNLEGLDEEIESSVSYYRMQSMNQSLAALVLRKAITREVAGEVSPRPGDLDLMLRKFLYAGENGEETPGDAMAEPLSDYSKIAELQEVKKLYDEMQERVAGDLAERDREIAKLRAQVKAHEAGGNTIEEKIAEFKLENERLAKQINLLRQDYEARIERLNGRIKELTAATPSTPANPGDKPGFFRR